MIRLYIKTKQPNKKPSTFISMDIENPIVVFVKRESYRYKGNLSVYTNSTDNSPMFQAEVESKETYDKIMNIISPQEHEENSIIYVYKDIVYKIEVEVDKIKLDVIKKFDVKICY